MERTTTDPSVFMHSLPDDIRAQMERLDALLTEAMAGRQRVMWEGKMWGGSEQNIIGYGDWSYTRSGGDLVEWFVVGLAAQKNYLSVYVNAVEDGAYLAEQVGSRLGKVKLGKSSISFTSIDDVDLEELAALAAKANRIVP